MGATPYLSVAEKIRFFAESILSNFDGCRMTAIGLFELRRRLVEIRRRLAWQFNSIDGNDMSGAGAHWISRNRTMERKRR